jgi:hypothetical protein
LDEEFYNLYSPPNIIGNKIKEDEMSRTRSTYGEMKMHTEFPGKKEIAWET